MTYVTRSLLEHELISDSDAPDVVSSVCLDGRLDFIALARIGSTIVSRYGIVAKIDRHVDFGLFNGFQLSCCERQVDKCYALKRTTKADWLQSAPYRRTRCRACQYSIPNKRTFKVPESTVT